MVAQLVRQDDGSYDYEEVDTRPKPVSNTNFLSQVSTEAAKSLPATTEFEAYEGAKKGGEDLVSEPSITEQTEKIRREIPSQVKFDPKTGEIKTEKAKAKYLEYKEPERTPESTEMTALEKVMSMPKQEQIDYSGIMKGAYQATQPTFKDQLLSSALDVGGNILTNYITKKMTGAAGDTAINYMTQNVLGKTMSGRLATGSGLMQGSTAAANPYVFAATMLMDKDIRKKATKTIKKVTKSIGDFISGGTVVCTELCRQGYISNEDLKLHWKYTINKFTKDQMKGYWIWGLPVAKKMKTNKTLTKIWFHIMKYRLKDVRYNIGKGKFSLLGKIYSFILENGSLLISKFISKKKTREVLV